MSNNSTDILTSESVQTTVGICYIMTGVIVIPLHIVCSWLIWNDKEMKNPTYQFILNLSIADVLELIPVCWYTGAIILFRLQYNPYTYLSRFIQFWCLSCWYVNAFLYTLTAFSRWVAMTHSHLVQHLFSKRNMRLMHTVPWVVVCVFYFYSCALYPKPTFLMYPQFYTWGFDMTLPYAEFLHYLNLGLDTSCTIIEMTFNIMSLYWVRQTRKTIQSLASSENHRREMKLLMQCIVIGMVFTLTYVCFTLTVIIGSPALFLGMHCVWMFNHSVNPIVYLTVNTKLRRAFIRLITRGKYGLEIRKPKTQTIPTCSMGPGTSVAVPSRANRVAPLAYIK